MQARLSPESVALYKFAVSTPSWTNGEAARELGLSEREVVDAEQQLLRLRLLRVSPDGEREHDAVGPETALAELLYDDEAEIRRRQVELARMRGEVMCLLPTYYEGRRAQRRHEAIDVIEDVSTINQLIADSARQATQQVLIAHPGGGMDADSIDRILQVDLDILARGIELRILLQHSTRSHPPSQEHARKVSEAGGLIKTVPIVPRRLLVYDREVAYIPLDGGDVSKGALRIKEPAVVDFVTATFSSMWDSGRPMGVGSDDEVDDIRSELTRAILGQLATGAKDDLIARRLGMSVRTCRRHIAAIMLHLRAESRFQAGALAAHLGLLEDEGYR